MRAYVVDSFTTTAFSGNPAGVVLLDAPAEAVWMQAVARELRHSETAFLVSDRPGSYGLRWFTPAVEVDLCGHATLAAAHVLAARGGTRALEFHTRSGRLSATVADDGAITLDFPARPATPISAPAGLAAALGADLLGCYGNGTDVLVEVASRAVVADLAPDLAALALLECRGVIVTARAADGPADGGADFVSRFFAPRVGVDEDPVTGSAHCALGPFWAQRVGRDVLLGAQLSARGGQVAVHVRGERVLLTGHAVTVFDGELAA